MATFNLVFDESGKKGDSPHVVFAGYFATSEVWQEFSREWRAILKSHGLTDFHAKWAFNYRNEWRKFAGRAQERDSIILSLARLAQEYPREANGNIVRTDSFNHLPIDKRKLYREDPFYCAFESGILSTIRNARVEPQDYFTMLCDDSEESSGESLRVYRKLRKKHPEVAKRFGGICFADDTMYPPLQLADLFAYCLRLEARDAPHGLWRDTLDVLMISAPGDAPTRADIIV